MTNKHTVKNFIKKYSARITAAILVVGAIGVGVLENNISNAEAINIGTGGSSPIAKGSGGKGSCATYPFVPGIAITPKIYDLTSAYQKNTAGNYIYAYEKNEKAKTKYADKKHKKGADTVTSNLAKGEAKYDEEYNIKPTKENLGKFNENKVKTYYQWISHEEKDKQKGGWFSYPKLGTKPTTPEEWVKNSIVKLNNFGRRNSLTNLITLRPEKLSKSSIVYISHASVNYHNHGNPYVAKWGLRVYTDDDHDGIKKGDDAQKQIVWMAQDGVSDFTDSDTAKNSSDQRKKNCNKLRNDIFSSYKNGVFDSLIHDEIKKMKEDKDYKDKWYIAFKGSDGKEHKVVNHIALMKYIEKKGGIDRLLKDAQNTKRGDAARKVLGLAANIYSNGSYFACPETIEDYVSMTAYHCINNKESVQNDLDTITKYYKGSKGNKAENEAYKSFLNGKDAAGNKSLDMDDIYHVGGSTDDKYKTFTARYIDSEYNLAYLDMLLCGYATSYKNATKNNNKFNGNENSKVVNGWKAAVKQFIKGANSNEDKFVTVRFDVCGIQQSKPSGYLVNIASAGDIAHTSFLGGGAQYQEITDQKESANSKAIVKSFIGIQNDDTSTKNNLQYNTNKQIKTYDDATDMNTLYKRIGKAAYESHSKKKKWNTYTQNNGLLTHALLQELFDLPSIFSASKNYQKQLKDNKPDMERVSFLKAGLGNGANKGAKRQYSYGTYATVPLEFYSFYEEDVKKEPGYEMRLYSVKAHGDKDLNDDDYPDQSVSADAPSLSDNKDGKLVHDTAETVKNIDIGKPTDSSRKMTLHDRIYLKLDSTNEEDSFNQLLGTDARVRVTYYGKDPEDTSNITGYESLSKLAKTDPQSDTMKLKDANDKQDKKQLDCINDDSKYSFKGVKIETKEDTDKNSTNFRSDDNHELYPPVQTDKNASAKLTKISKNASQIKLAKYYGKKDKKWGNTDKYMNLVWQTRLNEMTNDIKTGQNGIEITVPAKDKWTVVTRKDGTKVYSWEHYYRICIRAKIEILNEDGTYYYKDDNDKPSKEKSLSWTNPVYVTYHVKGGSTVPPKPEEPKFEFYGNNGSINNSESVKAHAYSEFKEGSVYNETFEAMAGVPSTRTMYFSTGGEEFMVNLQAVYDDYVAKNGSTVGKHGENVDPDAYRAVRQYTVHFNSVCCEYVSPERVPTDTFFDLCKKFKKVVDKRGEQAYIMC